MSAAEQDPIVLGSADRDATDAVDLTAMEASQRHEREAKDAMQSLSEDLKDLAYVASHDLKAPISVIEGYLRLLEQDPTITSPQSLDAIHWMGRAVEQARQTLVDVVEAVQARTEDIPLTTRIGLCALVEKSQIRYEMEIADSVGTIRVDLDECPEITFSLPHAQTIMDNLVGNAVKYRSDDRALEIGIRSWSDESFDYLEVSDNGIGIDLARDRTKVFGLFKRAVTHVAGTGLGLYIVEQAMTRAGGDIRVASTPGQGSRFTAVFPRVSQETV